MSASLDVAEHRLRVRPRQVEQIMFSLRDAAQKLGVHECTVRRWWKAGVIGGRRIGPRLIRIPTGEITRMQRELANIPITEITRRHRELQDS